MNELQSLITSISVDTAWGPSYTLDSPFASSADQAPNPFLAFAKPKISIGVAGLTTPIVVAPYGDPGDTNWPYVEAGLLVLGLGALWLMFR